MMRPARANPAPPYCPGNRRTRPRAMWPQMMAGTPTRMLKQTSDNSPKTKLVMAKPFSCVGGCPAAKGGEDEPAVGAKPDFRKICRWPPFRSTGPLHTSLAIDPPLGYPLPHLLDAQGAIFFAVRSDDFIHGLFFLCLVCSRNQAASRPLPVLRLHIFRAKAGWCVEQILRLPRLRPCW